MANIDAASVSSSRGSILWSRVILALLILSVFIAIYVELPPRPKPATAPSTEFSAVRAFHHIERMAHVTHPAGSFADDRVREYILGQLKGMNLEAVDQAMANPDGEIGVYHNVMARIPGTANTKAFAMAAHHDSVPYGPGATDDLGGVAAMLETARAIKAGPPLKNDIILVFTDAEEDSDGGARGFMEHPWAKDVGVMLNFEARGNSGPSYMFETSNENGWLVAEMVKAGVQPRATSIMYDVYKRSPFGSDFDTFKRRGLKGFNVAFVDNFCYYHTREDRPETLNLASLQHHGEYGLGLARHFGNISIGNATAPDATYFNTVGSHMVYYPLSWGKPLMAAAAAMLVLITLLGFVRRHLTVGGLLAGMGTFLTCAVLTALVTGLLTGLVFLVHGQYLVYHNNLYGTALVLIAISIIIASYDVFRRFVRTQDLAAGALVWWLALLVGLELYIPGGAYLALWPLVFAMIGMAVLFIGRPGPGIRPGLLPVTACFALPGIFLCVPSLVGFLAMGTILLSPAIAVFVLFLFGLLTPQLRLFELLDYPIKRALPLATGALGLILLLIGVFTNGSSATAPRFSCLSYGYDLDAGKAYWLSNDKNPDPWLRQFLPPSTPREQVAEFIPGDHRAYLKGPAPAAPITGPEIRVIQDEVVEGKRQLSFHVDSPRAVTKMRLAVVTDAEVFDSTILGKNTGAAKDHWGRSIELFPREGVDVTLKLDLGRSLRLKLTEEIYGLPAELNVPPRPVYLITEPNTTLDFNRALRSEQTFITKTVTL